MSTSTRVFASRIAFRDLTFIKQTRHTAERSNVETRREEMNDLEKLAEKWRCAGWTGAAMARALAEVDGASLAVGQFRELMGSKLGYGPRHANTYFYGQYIPARRAFEAARAARPVSEVASSSEPEPFPVVTVRETLRDACAAAVEWYLSRSMDIDRDRFLTRGGIEDAGRGAVYSYHSGDQDHDEAVYVGITGNKVKSRLYTQTSPHARSVWWEDWTYMRFVPVEAAGDRQVLEMLLIVGLAPSVNERPSAIDVERFLSA